MITAFSAARSSVAAADDAIGRNVADPPLEEVRVFASRYRQTEDPIALMSMAKEDDGINLNRTPGDWLEQIAGVAFTGQGGLLQSYSVRGFGRARLRTEVAGVPILTDRRAGNSVGFLPPDFVAQASVTKSASSALYGAGAMGGAVGFQLKEISNTRFSVDARSNGLGTGLSLFTPLVSSPLRSSASPSNPRSSSTQASSTQARSLSLGLSARRAPNSEDAQGASLNTEFEQWASYLSGKQEIASGTLNASWLVSRGSEIGKSNAQFPDQRVSSYPQDDHSVAKLEFFSEKIFARVYHHYQDWTTRVQRVGERENSTAYRATTSGFIAQTPVTLFTLDGTAGVEWLARRNVEIDDREQDLNDDSLIVQRLVDGEEDFFGVFMDQRWETQGKSLVALARYDLVDQRESRSDRSEDDDQWSGSVRFASDLPPLFAVSAELARSYRFPSLSERYFTGATPRGEVVGNASLKPEVRRSAELSLNLLPLSRGSWEFSGAVGVYRSDLDNYIERIALSDSALTFENLSNASLEGFEVEFLLSQAKASHSLSYQWQQGEDDTGNLIADLNPPSFRYALELTGQRFHLMSDLQYRPARNRAGPGEQNLASAWVWSGSIRRELSLGWRGEFYITNLTDELYRASADELAPFQPGRAFGLRLSWGNAAGLEG
ncbi:MAG: TonB-dependent receptor [Pseudomonadota bacterium]